MVKPLFPEPPEARTSALEMTEPAVRFFQEVTWEEAVVGRANINSWYEAFPDKERIRPRLLSDDNNEHNGALDELFLFHVINRPNWHIKFEEGGRGPDFRVYKDDELIAAVEVASFFMRDDWAKEWKDYGDIADALNRRIKSRGFLLQVEPELLDRTPRKDRIVKAAEKYLKRVEELFPAALDDMNTPHEIPADFFREEGVSIRLQALPLKNYSLDGGDQRVAAIGPVIGGMVNSAERLRGVLRSKRPARYKLEDVSYVIVVANHDLVCSDDSILAAIYGDGQIRPTNDGSVELEQAGNGFFGLDRKRAAGKNKRVTGVGVLDGFSPWLPESAAITLFDNPFARHSAIAGLLPVARRFAKIGDIDDRYATWGWSAT